MKLQIKRCKNPYPETHYSFTLIEICFINTYQVISLNIILFNILIKFRYDKT